MLKSYVVTTEAAKMGGLPICSEKTWEAASLFGGLPPGTAVEGVNHGDCWVKVTKSWGASFFVPLYSWDGGLLLQDQGVASLETEPSGGAEVTIAINGLAGRLCEVRARSTWSILELKRAVQDQLGIPHFQQRLFAMDVNTELLDSAPMIESLGAEQRGGAEITEKDLDFLGGRAFTLVRLPSLPPEFLAAWTWGQTAPELSRDRSLVLSVLASLSGADALLPAAPELKADVEVVLAAVRRNGLALRHASPELRAEREVVLAAVEQDGGALEHADRSLRGDEEVLRTSLRSCGAMLKLAPTALRARRDLALLAARQSVSALRFAGEGLLADASFIDLDRRWLADARVALALVEGDGWLLQYLSPERRADHRVALAAVQNNGWALQFAADSLRDDWAVVSAAVQRSGMAIQYASPALRNNAAMAELAVRSDHGAYYHVSPALQEDAGFRGFADRQKALQLAAAERRAALAGQHE